MLMKCGHCVECCDPAPPRCTAIGRLRMFVEEKESDNRLWAQEGDRAGVGGDASPRARRHGKTNCATAAPTGHDEDEWASARRRCSEYRSLYDSQDIMPSSIRQRRGLACLALLQLPKKRTNVDPKNHKNIKAVHLCKTSAQTHHQLHHQLHRQQQQQQQQQVYARRYHRRERTSARRAAWAPGTRAYRSQTQKSTNAGKRSRADIDIVDMNRHLQPFTAGSGVDIQYFLNPGISASASPSPLPSQAQANPPAGGGGGHCWVSGLRYSRMVYPTVPSQRTEEPNGFSTKEQRQGVLFSQPPPGLQEKSPPSVLQIHHPAGLKDKAWDAKHGNRLAFSDLGKLDSAATFPTAASGSHMLHMETCALDTNTMPYSHALAGPVALPPAFTTSNKVGSGYFRDLDFIYVPEPQLHL